MIEIISVMLKDRGKSIEVINVYEFIKSYHILSYLSSSGSGKKYIIVDYVDDFNSDMVVEDDYIYLAYNGDYKYYYFKSEKILFRNGILSLFIGLNEELIKDVKKIKEERHYTHDIFVGEIKGYNLLSYYL